MKQGHRIFQLYLLRQMRNTDAVRKALLRLTASDGELFTARDQMIQRGFEEPVVQLSAYELLLGKPFKRTTDDRAPEYERVRLAFQLDVWPEMLVVTFGSREGVAAGIRFEHQTPKRGPHSLASLRPWRNVRSDLESGAWRLTKCDEWYPVLDLKAQSASTSEGALLQFDFDLLQNVLPSPSEVNAPNQVTG